MSESEFKIITNNNFDLFNTDISTQIPISKQLSDTFSDYIKNKIKDENIQKCLENETYLTFNDSVVCIRKIQSYYYFHSIMYSFNDNASSTLFSIILSVPEADFDTSNNSIRNYNNIHVVEGSLNFFSDTVNKDGSKFNKDGNCKNHCQSCFNMKEPTVNKNEKYIEWAPADNTNCLIYKQCYMTEEKELQPNCPKGRDTHEQHIAKHYSKKKGNNLGLILGIVFGSLAFIAILYYYYYYIYKKNK